MRNKWFKLAGALAALWVLQGSMVFGQSATPPCIIEDAQFKCGDGELQGEALLAAFADAETRSYLQALRYGGGIYKSRQEREVFRKSLERINRALGKTVRTALRQRKRRRITEEEFEALKVQYAASRETYESAINLYREGSWFSDRLK